ncbi:hypothetical protein DAI22_12g217450 [Oryza sativa Japonica Group]|nr:hypothetical protein DAI22_12g217450 [Oryza sativa Japonica Group]
MEIMDQFLSFDPCTEMIWLNYPILGESQPQISSISNSEFCDLHSWFSKIKRRGVLKL